jgi:hypothetical protein
VSDNVALTGFEEALAAAIAAGFRFAGETLQNVPLLLGRHLFVGYLPPIDRVQGDKPVGQTFDPQQEPAIALYPASGGGALPSNCDSGKHEFVVEIALRIPKETQRASHLLDELVRWIKASVVGGTVTGSYGDFAVGELLGTIPNPTPFRRLTDGSAVSTVRLRFFAVPLI